LLSYDFVFLALLLATRPFSVAERYCVAHSLKKRAIARDSPALDAAADSTVFFAYFRLLDDAADEKLCKRATAGLAAKLMRGAYRRAKKQLPRVAETMEHGVKTLRRYELSDEPSLDRVASVFSEALSTLSEAAAEDERLSISELLRHIGRWIYIVDAIDDFEHDVRQGGYNPVEKRYTIVEPHIPMSVKAELALTLAQSRAAALNALFALKNKPYAVILENVLVHGMSIVEKKVLDNG
jgi:hypothetical protein